MKTKFSIDRKKFLRNENKIFHCQKKISPQWKQNFPYCHFEEFTKRENLKLDLNLDQFCQNTEKLKSIRL